MKKMIHKRRLRKLSVVFSLLLLFCAQIPSQKCSAQGLHFSQYYNAPLLLNPANTALMPETDFRAGFNFRNQWSSLPVPFRTISAYADLQAFRNRNQTNWLGVGAAFFNDKSGNGELSLTRFEGFLAYHVQLGLNAMISAGASVASVQRTVNFNALTYDVQWDGFGFNKSMANLEDANIARTKYTDISAGVNFAYFPDENMYLKVGLGLSHINQPRETFYEQANKIGMRPNGNIDLILKLSPTFILNPSLYFTNQRGASELAFGTMTQFYVSGDNIDTKISLIFGGYYRWADAAIATVGLQIDEVRIMSSYDFTVSSLSPVNKGRGAFEIGVMYQGVYSENSRNRTSYGCPRF